MKNLFLLLLISVIFFSCEEKKIEFIKSEPIGNLILLKNLPEEDSLIKNQISYFILKNYKKYDKSITYFSFYRYTTDTKFFLKNREDISGGVSNHELNDYPEDELAYYLISKCENDSTQLVGKFHFYGLRGSINGQNKSDTLIYKCN